MLFNSFEFILFFPVVTLLYFLLPHKFRWFHLLVASCYFYMAFIPYYILILGGTIVVDYLAGILIENSNDKRKRKFFLIMSLIANIGVLAVFKYYNFFIENINTAIANLGFHGTIPYLSIILPIGLSFHTFQAMSYTIEVYRGNFPAERHFGIYALYVMFYPQLVAGPIERPQNVLPQLKKEHKFNYDNAVEGFRLILWGMFKKVVIADRLAIYVDEIYKAPSEYHFISVLLGTYFFAFQIYCDFSGYSDIAIGAARVMGINLMENFRLPYLAKNVREFWSRWHISLSTWFRDYLYIPLGGNRVKESRFFINILIVFMISGLWHGANWTFIVWGLLHGLYLIFERLLGKTKAALLPNGFKMFLTFNLVVLAWVFFRADSVNDAIHVLYYSFPHKLSDLKHLPDFHSLITIPELFLNIGLILLLIFIEYTLRNKKVEKINFIAKPWRWLLYYTIAMLIIFFGYYGKESQFIYFQF